MRAADLVVCVPWYEPFGIVPIEAVACGGPVVGSAVGGLLDSVADGRTGLLVPPRDPAATAAALNRVLGDEEYRLRLGRDAAAHVAERFGWARVAELTEAVYARLAEPAGAAAASSTPATAGRGADSAAISIERAAERALA